MLLAFWPVTLAIGSQAEAWEDHGPIVMTTTSASTISPSTTTPAPTAGLRELSQIHRVLIAEGPRHSR